MEEQNFISYGYQYIDDQDVRAVINVLESDRLTQGDKVCDFESQLAKYCDAKYAVVVSSGTAALHLAYLVTGVHKNDQVVTSPLNFVASSSCAIYCGAIPDFVDIDVQSLTLSVDELGNKLRNSPVPIKAIIPMHYAGYPCDMKGISQLAKKYHCVVIEDACHALGATYAGKKIGSCQFSDITTFSFHPVKSITTGEGGALLTNNYDLYKKAIELRSHSAIQEKGGDGWFYNVTDVGYNYRLTDIQAALGISQLKKLPFFLQKRRELVDLYYNELSDDKRILLPVYHSNRDDVQSAWHLMPVRLNVENAVELKQQVLKRLKQNGISPQVHYIPIHLHQYYQQTYGLKKGDFPLAEKVYDQVFSLPLYVSLAPSKVRYICKVLKDIVRSLC